MRILRIDDKWSIEYDPKNNCRPETLYRYATVMMRGQHMPNYVVAMFYKLLEEEEKNESQV